MYQHLIRPLLFRCDPERMHDLSISSCEVIGRHPRVCALLRRTHAFDHPMLRTRVAGIEFANPLGLAAGYDKNGRAVRALAALGFGHVEIGSISGWPSSGNPRPPAAVPAPAGAGHRGPLRGAQ